MATSVLPSTYKNGFRQPRKGTPWVVGAKEIFYDDEPHWVTPPSSEILSSDVHNSFGLNTIRSWPTMYDGTNSPHGLPKWWKPSTEVDVLICGGIILLRFSLQLPFLYINSWPRRTSGRCQPCPSGCELSYYW